MCIRDSSLPYLLPPPPHSLSAAQAVTWRCVGRYETGVRASAGAAVGAVAGGAPRQHPHDQPRQR
eukprot:3551428-Rhodomonas_salina.1